MTTPPTPGTPPTGPTQTDAPTPEVTPELRRARRLLALLADRGGNELDHHRHMAVLVAFDTLESAATVPLPPPDPPGPGDDQQPLAGVLAEAVRRLDQLQRDPGRHRLDPVLLAVAGYQLSTVLEGWAR